ncbi:MAG: hypothetical protein HF978_14040 [Desulfobacteraceae bacterium]|nr:hypothetical protein [Desulfobacteraceae bacterium]MBC2756660.1 hypothetical protein [Desulfobacteraceae bacterium]
MAKKYFLLIILSCFIGLTQTDTHATDLGINAGVLLPADKFNHAADTGFGIGSQIKLHVFEDFYYGLAVNYGSAKGNNGVDFWEVDLYPFVDWIFFRPKKTDVFVRGGIGLSHWESDGIWWLDDEGNGVAVTFGMGCKTAKNLEVTACFTKLYADFDVDYFTIKLGYNFYIGD